MTPSTEMTVCDSPVFSSVWLNSNTPINPMLMNSRGVGVSLTVGSENPMQLSLSARKAITKVNSFSVLTKNWDGNGADSIDPLAINEADKLLRNMDRKNLPIYFVSPTRDGGIMVEFDDRSGKAVEVYINSIGPTDMLLIHEGEMTESAYNESALTHHFKQ